MSVIDLLRRLPLRASRTSDSHSSQVPHQAQLPIPQATVQRALQNPHSLLSPDMLYLQRTIGNSKLSQMLQSSTNAAPSRPATMTVGASNDAFEQEAEAISTQIAEPQQASVQRSSLPQVDAEGGAVSRGLESRIQRAKGGGAPAPEGVRRMMEAQTGADFSGVRVHHDTEAEVISSQLGAKAATHGKDIFLARNQSPHDVQLMAHELTHTIQQGAVQSEQGLGDTQTMGRRAPAVQREDDEEKIKKLKAKKRGAKFGAGALKALDWLTTAPLHLIDELSITDLHVKDFVNFARTGKTRKKRQKARGMEGLGKHTKGNIKRAFGRTGLRGYLSGTKTHKMMYTNALNKFDLPWHSQLNPFTQMQTGVGGLNKKVNKYSDQISNLKAKRQQNMLSDEDNSVQGGLQDEETSVMDVLDETLDEEEVNV